MSLAKNTHDKISEQEYLEGEKISEVRHEYIDGAVYAMSGGTANHNRIIGNFSRKLGNALEEKNSPCEIFFESVKVREVTDCTKFFYPDIFVVCDKHKDDNAYYINSPVIIVEVLSKSTRKYDLTTKKLYYFNMPTLQEYVVIEQDLCQIMVFRRNNDWKTDFYYLGDSITFGSIDMTLSVKDIYYHVDNDEIISYLKQDTEKMH